VLMKFSNKVLAQTLTVLCQSKGIQHIVISPGSRNAPLIIGFTNNDYFTCYSIVDERSAAFFALGIAQQLQKPVVLVCTSGSALLNYYPAVAEAYYSDIPLVVLSADRPVALIEIGDGQTIKQENVYENHILYSANCIEGDEYQIHNETQINIALNTATEVFGPVHINCPFSEPLYQTVAIPQVRPQDVPARRVISEELNKAETERIEEHWSNSKKRIVLIGVLQPNSIEKKWMDTLAQDSNTLVLTETTSNVHHQNFFPSIDQFLAPLTENQRALLKPDLLVTFGGMVVSKKIKAFLRTYKPEIHWHIDLKKAYDTYFSLKRHFKMQANDFLSVLLTESTSKNLDSDFKSEFIGIKKLRLEGHSRYMNTIQFSDFWVFGQLFNHLPKDINLQLSNSTTIRYSQLFDIDSSIQVFCNRGTSGIDGSTSTAIGAAKISDRDTIFITGDLSFFYDSNALWNNYIPKNFKIILVNNAGGGIFKILPNAKKIDHFETFFETKHSLTAQKVCEQFGVSYSSVNSKETLESELPKFLSRNESTQLLEIFTPSEINDSILLDYFDYLK
jgi:2-succinyl-5-enolpyruvyl-6-hydroxy-3-cyclohexene-1-carboxylate synthase